MIRKIIRLPVSWANWKDPQNADEKWSRHLPSSAPRDLAWSWEKCFSRLRIVGQSTAPPVPSTTAAGIMTCHTG